MKIFRFIVPTCIDEKTKHIYEYTKIYTQGANLKDATDLLQRCACELDTESPLIRVDDVKWASFEGYFNVNNSHKFEENIFRASTYCPINGSDGYTRSAMIDRFWKFVREELGYTSELVHDLGLPFGYADMPYIGRVTFEIPKFSHFVDIDTPKKLVITNENIHQQQWLKNLNIMEV